VHTLTLKSEFSGPVAVVTAIGELDLHTQDLFEQAVGEHVALGPVIVNLAQVEFLAISALRSLLLCNAMATPGGLVYVDAPQQARRLLAVSGVADLLCLQDTVVAPLMGEPLAG